MTEDLFDVRWDGPFAWGEHRDHVSDDHVLYSLYGFHPQYGSRVLLYIGQSRASVKRRLNQHAAWVRDEADAIQVRLGSIGRFKSWDSWKADTPYPRADQIRSTGWKRS
jgi:hypothetical protein